jgi:hypothetical protein
VTMPQSEAMAKCQRPTSKANNSVKLESKELAASPERAMD